MEKNVFYSEEELEDRSRDMKLIRRAREMREQPHPQFDDMGYTDWYKSNEKASYTYNPPKKNESDKRIVSGITNDKILTLTSHFLNYNFKPDVEAFDDTKGDVVFVNRERLGNHIEDMLRKEEEIENFEDRLGQIYMEAFAQGDAFALLTDEPERVIKKKLKKTGWKDGEKIKMADLAFTEEEEYKNYRKISTKLISGLNFYHGNIYEQSIEKQPYIVIRDLLSYDEAKSAWGAFERFEYVPKYRQELEGDDDYASWLQGDTRDGFVEFLMIQEKGSNRMQVYLNGVAMFPVGFPLSSIFGICDYSIEKLSTESRYGFAYSKGQVAKIKVNHALFDIFLRAFVTKTEQSAKPPMGNNTGTDYGMEVFNAGNIIPDLSKEDFFPIIETPGVTQAEMGMMDTIKRIIDQDSVSPIFQGQSMKGQQTLGEIQRLESQTAKKLGYAMLGITQFHRRLAWKKIYAILQVWTQPIDTRISFINDEIKNVYRKITVETEDQGLQAEKIINFVDDEVPAPEQENAMGEILSKYRGKKTKVAHLSVPELQALKYVFFVTVVPTEKETSELRAARFEESMMKALQIFPPLGKQLNLDYLGTRWAQHNDEDPERLFAQQASPDQAQAQAMQSQVMGQGGAAGSLSAQMQPKQSRQPSINTLVNAQT